MNRIASPAPIANYRADIDGLRAVAILLVLWFHAFPDTLPGGYIGVDVFFVISGFLITGIVLRGLEKDHFSFAHFYAQRARRLLPALMVVLPATLAAGWHWLWPQEFAQLATHTAAAAAFVLNIVLWTEAGYFDVATELKPLMHLWSLGIEEQFYLLYPCLLWLAWRAWRRPLVAIAAVVVISFCANLLWVRHDPSGTFFLPHTRFWELALGGVLAWWQHRARHIATQTTSNTQPVPGAAARSDADPTPALWRQALPWLGLAAIGTGAATLTPGTPYPGTAALLPVVGSLLLIASGPYTWVNRHVLGSRFMVLIGLISYPLYLWHWPILSFLRIVHSDTPPLLLRCAAVIASIVLAWLTFRYVETPIRFGSRRRLRLAGVAATVCAIALTAWSIRLGSGIPERLPAEAGALLAYQYDYREGYREGSCFLRPEQSADAFATCPDTWVQNGENWLLWGDSHAAHLHPGMQARYGGNTPFVQRTASGCPPLFDESFPDRPHCPAIQDYVWQEIEAHHPQRVTLAARWDFYDWHKLGRTVERLRALGVRHIDLVGPVPQWHNGLPRQAAIAYRENGFKVLPERLAQGLLPEPFKVDQEMAAQAARLGVNYLSPILALCNEQGCLARAPDSADALTTWDDAHLTKMGSERLVSAW